MKIKSKLKEFFALERNIAVVCLSNLLWASNGLYREFIPKIYQSLGASLLVVGILFSLRDTIYTISSLIGGYLSDRYGRKKTWIIAAFIGNFCC